LEYESDKEHKLIFFICFCNILNNLKRDIILFYSKKLYLIKEKDFLKPYQKTSIKIKDNNIKQIVKDIE